MLAARPAPMSFDAYMAWEAEQDEKWELVDGQPVLRSERWGVDPVTGMAGASFGHNLIVANIMLALNTRLRGGPCRALPSDMKLRSPTRNARFPDVTVECGRPDRTALLSVEPRVLFEVLSPSNRPGKQLELLIDYQATPSVAQIVFVEQDEPTVLTWSREQQDWRSSLIKGTDEVLPVPALDLELPLAEIFEGIDFEPIAANG